MFDGIGAKGGMKDLKQTLKNIKKKKKQQRQELEERKAISQKQEQEKKRKEIFIDTSSSESIPAPINQSPLENVEISEKKKIPNTNERITTKSIEKDKRKFNEVPSFQQDKKNHPPSEVKEIVSPVDPSEEIEESTILSEPNTFTDDLSPILDLEESLLDNSPIKKEVSPSSENPFPKNRERIDQVPPLGSPVNDKELSISSLPPNQNIMGNQQKKLEVQSAVQEEILELKVTIELERLLKDNRYELKKLYTELDALKKESDYLYQVSDAEQAIEEIERLLEYLERIKKQLKVISEANNLDLIFQLDDSYFTNLVEDYKRHIKDQQVIEDKIKDLKRNEEYTSLMKKILEFEKIQENLANTLEERKEELEERDFTFDKIQDEYFGIEKINLELESLIYESEKYLSKIEEKVNEAVDITTRTEIKMHYSMGILARTLLLLSLFKMNPHPKANAITAVETVVAIDLIHKLLKPRKEQRTITEYHYHNYSNMIENALGDIDSISYLIQDGIKEVQELKKTFKEEFKDYADILPEYKSLLSSIDKIERELKEREENMLRVQKDMNVQLEKNNQKVLDYERLQMENN